MSDRETLDTREKWYAATPSERYQMSAGEMQRQLELRNRAMAQDQAAADAALRQWQGMQGMTPDWVHQVPHEPPVEYPGPLEGFPPAPRKFFAIELVPLIAMAVALVLAAMMVL